MGQAGMWARRLEIGWIDVVLAVGLSVAATLQAPAEDSLSASPAGLLCTVPLLVRRRFPVAVVVASLVGFTVGANAIGFASLLGGLIAILSLGLYSRHQNLAWLVVLGAALLIAVEFGRGSTTTLPVPGVVLPFVLMGAAYLAGREIASRQRKLNEERERASRLEHEHEQAVQAAAEAERRHIARELHDVVAHSVSVMLVQAGAARQVMADKPDAARQALLAVEASGHEAMTELRRLLGVLGENGDEPPLDPQPGIDGLEALVARVKEAGLPVDVKVEGERIVLPPGIDVAAYRIAQEALTNALKYAGGARTEVVITYSANAVEIEVVDEGAVPTPSDGIGRGLVGMRERVALFGGTIEAGKRPARGYAVRAHLPIDQSA